MSHLLRRIILYIACAAWLQAVLVGCNGKQSGRVNVDPQTAAAEAVRMYDTNQDGNIDSAECEKSPALYSALERIDVNHNGLLTAQEIATRLERYTDGPTHIGMQINVVNKRKPLANASVEFIPEPFLGSGYPTYLGKTNRSGTANPLATPPTPGVTVGLYTVKITSPDGTESIQGCEIAGDVPGVNRLSLQF